MIRTVVYGATRNLYEQMIASANSVLQNGNVDEVVLLIEDDALPYQPNGPFRFINVASQTFFDVTGANASKRWSWMTLMRCALAHLLPDDRVLWLDCDTIVNHDISELWDLDLTGLYYAAVPQQNDGRQGQFLRGAYFNAGVLLCNLAELRDGKEAEIIQALNEREYAFPDQDVINELCQNRIVPLAGRYNTCRFTVQDTETYITHYADHGLPPQEVKRYGKLH